MDIKELITIFTNERAWISRRLSTIDGLLDRAAYRNASDVEELTEEYEELEKRLEVIRNVEMLMAKINVITRSINLIEDNIDNLACFRGNEIKIESLYKEIKELEEKKDVMLKEIEKHLKGNEENKKTPNKR